MAPAFSGAQVVILDSDSAYESGESTERPRHGTRWGRELMWRGVDVLLCSGIDHGAIECQVETGPMGMGIMTGRAVGYCAGFNAPGYMHSVRGRGISFGGSRVYGDCADHATGKGCARGTDRISGSRAERYPSAVGRNRNREVIVFE